MEVAPPRPSAIDISAASPHFASDDDAIWRAEDRRPNSQLRVAEKSPPDA